MSDDELLRDPDEETAFRWQNDKETLGGSTSRQPPPWKIGDQLDDFVLDALLGVGSSGFVYRVQDLKTGRQSALKLLKHGPPDDLLRNKLGFRRMMMFDHPNLLRVDRIHQLGSYVALSMEEVEGRTLRATRKELGQLPRDGAYGTLLRWVREYASGLSAMHANGLVHRDIKPDNLMVDWEGNGRVIDYGLVDAYEVNRATIETRGFLLGTPHYIAPEVIWSQRYLPAGDIFSLGIVLLDTLRMLERMSVNQKVDLQRSKQSQLDDAERIVEAIDDLPDSVPEILRATCREMLDRYPSERPTAMMLARLGLPVSHQIPWSIEPAVLGRQAERDKCLAWVDEIFAGNSGRLHLTGDSGIGKSRLLKEIIQYIESKNWGQVFAARCRVHEDQPLQVFDQICDAIAHRYMKGDRERLRMDPVSVTILQTVFPVLKNVLEATLQLAPAARGSEARDAMEAAARLSEQLRQVGPLFVVVDDSQWADRDSRDVLDHLQSVTCGNGLGIVTVSRNRPDPHRIPASCYVHLDPLGESNALEMLTEAASRWGVTASEAMLRRLVRLSGGIPFRLRELAEEFRLGGALHDIEQAGESDITDLSPLDRLWQRRAERLSDEAKRVLPLIVTAGGHVSIEQLAELTGLVDSVEATVTELVRQRLVIDEATGGECITIYHDRVADELIKTFSDRSKREAHHAWAALLVRQNHPERRAARIASHWFAAGQPGRAVAHAILAAEDAERRVAKAEAGRWYAKVTHHVSGEERIRQLRNAARCFHEANYPLQASKYFQELSQLVEGEERIECIMLATTTAICCGRLEQVRRQLHELAGLMGLPKPKAFWKSQLSLSLHAMRHALGGQRMLLKSLAAIAPDASGTDDTESKSADNPVQSSDDTTCRRRRQAIRLCRSLVRPLSIFDNRYAAELSVAGARLAMRYGDPPQRVHAAVVRAVFGCYDAGRRRVESESSLWMLKPQVERLGDDSATGDLWSGIAYSHALACRWDHVSQPVELAVEHYQRIGDANSFEISHTRWPGLWAKWHLGLWEEMQQLGDLMLDDALRRDDMFKRIVAMGGFGVGAWLLRDRIDEIEFQRKRSSEVRDKIDRLQLLHHFDSIAVVQMHIYLGQYEQAWQALQRLELHLQRAPFKRIQMLRVASQLFGAIIGLHQLDSQPNNHWSQCVQHYIRHLRKERIGFARSMADYAEATLACRRKMSGDSDVSKKHVIELLQVASDQCRQRQLRPYYLAADDLLVEMQSGHPGDSLVRQMQAANVVHPQRAQRMYGISSEI